MAASLMPQGKQSYVTASGQPLVGGKIYTYQAGTNTPLPTWSDAGQLAPNTNPVILDARGEASIFWRGVYKVILKDPNDVTIWTVDNIQSDVTTGAVPWNLPDEANGDAIPAIGSKLPYLSGGVMKIA